MKKEITDLRSNAAAICDAPAVVKLDMRQKRLANEALESAREARAKKPKQVRALANSPAQTKAADAEAENK